MEQNDSDDRELFDHLVAEFGDRGRDAVAFLQTALALVHKDSEVGLERRAGAAAYCAREALKRLLPPEDSPLSWRKTSDEVLNAKKRLEVVRGLPTELPVALQDLLNAIDGLEEFKKGEQGLHERRLSELMVARTGTQPLSGALREYQGLLRELNEEAVHGSPSTEQVQALLARAMAVLKMVFGPFQLRKPELEAIARLQEPHEGDTDRLLSLCSTPHHLTYFMQRAVSPQWLLLLGRRNVIEPPQHGEAWPALILVQRLAASHAPEIAAWLEVAYSRWGSSEAGAAWISTAARMCLPDAATTLLRALHEHSESYWIRSQASLGLDSMDPSIASAEAMAEALMSPGIENRSHGFTEAAMTALVGGMTAENADARILLLARHLTASLNEGHLMLASSRLGSVEDVAEDGHRVGEVLLTGVISAVRRASELGIPTMRVLPLLDQVPNRLLARLRVWILTEATDVSNQFRVAEITQSISLRSPTGDDVRLIQLIVSEAGLDLAPWRSALGDPPTPEEVGKALGSHDIPVAWQRKRLWHPLLPQHVRRQWDTAVDLMAATLPAPSQSDYLEKQSGLDLEHARSPIARSELEVLEVAEAARKISSWRPTGDFLLLARELGRILEDLVSDRPRDWAEHPLATLALLRHATYVHHYFLGLGKTSGDLSGLGPRLVEAVVFARTHPWDIVRLGGDDFDYDPTWAPVDEAGIALIGHLAARDVDLGNQHDDAWRAVLEAARDRSQESGLLRRDEPLESAINRPCTRALEAMFHLMGAEFRRDGQIRSDAFDLLDEVLVLDGWNGAEHRAIIAPRLGFLLHVAPKWVDSRKDQLFGKMAPDGLGATSVALALKWGRPNPWLLERYRRSALHATRTGSKNAIDQVLVAMLWNVPGYSTRKTLRSLAPMGADVMSKAGEVSARLLSGEADREHLARGIEFWRDALQDSSIKAPAYRGFGWWAEVHSMDREQWETMMLATCERSEGSLDWCVQTAERSSSEPLTTTGLTIIARLLRGRHEPWDRSLVAEIGLRALKASGGKPNLVMAREGLRAALTDVGYFDAAEL